MPIGIIPARAGFTVCSCTAQSAHPDHPRSRGVYAVDNLASMIGVGSSPLARGLLRFSQSLGRAGGIIPARAGFTCPRPSASSPSADHPRSRGVYMDFGFQFPSGTGSSPLARGLLIVEEDGSVTYMDHPRSRGVYSPHPPPTRGRQGSSPLARGLPWQVICGARDFGIIPARAGFTNRNQLQTSHVTDHPRSRGVYSFLTAWTSPMTGSSPLARGLRVVHMLVVVSGGIIPARAGFTYQG